MKPDPRLIQVARGIQPADIIFRNCAIVNVFTAEIEKGDIAVYHGRIAGIGKYEEAKQIIDFQGRYVFPGLIDGHVHLESSMLDVDQYARAVVAHGTLSIVTDLHEIANVCGLAGIRYILDSAASLPLDLFLMAPSCVPSTRMETSGAELGPEEIRRLLRLKQCIGLGEVMNYPGVLFADDVLLRKIRYTGTKIIDGHAPGMQGRDLNAYIAAGVMSDHESVAAGEAKEKLRRGMFLMIREGSSEKNLDVLLPLVTDATFKRCFFVVDDRTCADLQSDGDMDAVLRKAIRRGLDPIRAIQMSTINTAEYFRLDGLGAVAPGYYANIIVTDSLTILNADIVFYRGKRVAENGKPLFSSKLEAQSSKLVVDTVNIKPLRVESLILKASGAIEPVIEVIPGKIVTKRLDLRVKAAGGVIMPDLNRDIIKLVVVERHKATGNVGLGLVKGIGLKGGALASSIAHDSHNIVVAGTNDADILTAIEEIRKMNGGLTVILKGKVLGSLALPVAGLLSKEPLDVVVNRLNELERLVKGLGCTLSSPFATLSFLALPVIPELRLTDLGLVDVDAFKLIERV